MVRMIIITIIIITRDKSIIFQNEISASKTYYYLLYILLLSLYVLTARETRRDVPIILYTHIICIPTDIIYWYYIHITYITSYAYYVTHCECVVGNDIIVTCRRREIDIRCDVDFRRDVDRYTHAAASKEYCRI